MDQWRIMQLLQFAQQQQAQQQQQALQQQLLQLAQQQNPLTHLDALRHFQLAGRNLAIEPVEGVGQSLPTKPIQSEKSSQSVSSAQVSSGAPDEVPKAVPVPSAASKTSAGDQQKTASIKMPSAATKSSAAGDQQKTASIKMPSAATKSSAAGDQQKTASIILSSESSDSASEKEDDNFTLPVRRSSAKRKSKDDEEQQSKLPLKQLKPDHKKPAAKSKAVKSSSKAKGSASKNELADTLNELQAQGAATIINLDKQGTGSRNLRSTMSKATIGIDFNPPKNDDTSQENKWDWEPSKNFDPEIIERLEACILNTTTTWDEVIGLDSVKKQLREAVVIPLLRPDLFVYPRVPPKGVLLYGPPGTGKTLLGKCAASSAKCTFFAITASDLMSKWMGDAEKSVAALFHLAQKKQPSIIFIDEIDSLLSSRREGEHDCIRRMKTELLAQWDGLTKPGASNVIVIGATNRPMDLDSAAMRRFNKHLYVPLPEREARQKMFYHLAQTNAIPVNLRSVDCTVLSSETEGYSAADIANVIRDSCMWPLREMDDKQLMTVKPDELRPVDRIDIQRTLVDFKPSCNEDEVIALSNWKSNRSS